MEITALSEAFKEQNKEELSAQELQVVLQKLVAEGKIHIPPSCPLFHEEMIKLFDIDESGGVNEKELIGGVALLCKGTFEEKIQLSFRAFSNSNQVIDRAGLHRLFKVAYFKALQHLEDFYKNNEAALCEIKELKAHQGTKV